MIEKDGLHALIIVLVFGIAVVTMAALRIASDDWRADIETHWDELTMKDV